jgi:hypothetical protein
MALKGGRRGGVEYLEIEKGLEGFGRVENMGCSSFGRLELLGKFKFVFR